MLATSLVEISESIALMGLREERGTYVDGNSRVVPFAVALMIALKKSSSVGFAGERGAPPARATHGCAGLFYEQSCLSLLP
jgi:hypothetical protein